VLQPKRV